MVRRQVLILLVVPAIIIGALVWFIVGRHTGPSFAEVADHCNAALGGSDVVQVSDGGNTLIVGPIGDNTDAPSSASAVTTVASGCVLDELKAPDSVRAKMNDTSQMQGRLTDSWDSYKVSWTYSPGAGMAIVVEKK